MARKTVAVGGDRTDVFNFEVVHVLKAAGFKVRHNLATQLPKPVEITAQRDEVGRTRQYAVEIKLIADGRIAKEILELFSRVRTDGPEFAGEHYDEFWLVASQVSQVARREFELHSSEFRIFTLDELERLLSVPKSTRPRRSKPRTKVGKAVVVNEQQIAIAIAALRLSMVDRIRVLRLERPNSDEAKANRDSVIADYISLKGQLKTLEEGVNAFRKGETQESAVVKSVSTFADGIQAWWTKSAGRICDKVLDMSMFLSAVGICTMAGAGGNVSVVVSAALVGGKPVADVLKGLGKRLFKGD